MSERSAFPGLTKRFLQGAIISFGVTILGGTFGFRLIADAGLISMFVCGVGFFVAMIEHEGRSW